MHALKLRFSPSVNAAWKHTWGEPSMTHRLCQTLEANRGPFDLASFRCIGCLAAWLLHRRAKFGARSLSGDNLNNKYVKASHRWGQIVITGVAAVRPNRQTTIFGARLPIVAKLEYTESVNSAYNQTIHWTRTLLSRIHHFVAWPRIAHRE